MEAMRAALRFVLIWGGFLAVILIPIWPLLALAAGTWSQGMGSLTPGMFYPVITISCAPYVYYSRHYIGWTVHGFPWVAAGASEICHNYCTLQLDARCKMSHGSVLLHSSADVYGLCMIHVWYAYSTR